MNFTARETLREYGSTLEGALTRQPWFFPNRWGRHVSAQQLGEIVTRRARLAKSRCGCWIPRTPRPRATRVAVDAFVALR